MVGAKPEVVKRIVHFDNLKTAGGPQTVEAYVRTPIAHSGQVATPSATASGESSAASGSGLIGIVVDHQANQSLCDSMSWADTFAAEGYLAIAPTLDDSYQVPETEASVGYLRTHGATKIVLLGASMGGTSVLITAAQLQPPVQAVISVSGPATYSPLDASVTAPKLTVPVFYSAGADDESFASDETSMYQATPAKDKVLDIVPGNGDHGFDLLGALLEKVNAFIRAHTG
jgi:dienelactone hydrolase